MNKIKYSFIILSLGLFLSACEDSSSNKGKVTEPDTIIPVAADGKIYYSSQCATCHSAGDDRSTAFGAFNLGPVNKDRIQSNMSDLGGVVVSGNIVHLMGRFKNVRPQRVADLKAYLSSL